LLCAGGGMTGLKMKKFYKARLLAEEEGLRIRFDIFIAFRETKYYFLCIDERKMHFMSNNITVKEAKGKKIKVSRIMKGNSRIGFESPELAIENLKLIKRRQLDHFKREKEFIDFFLSCEDSGYDNVNFEKDRCLTLKGSKDLVNDYLVFS